MRVPFRYKSLTTQRTISFACFLFLLFSFQFLSFSSVFFFLSSFPIFQTFLYYANSKFSTCKNQAPQKRPCNAWPMAALSLRSVDTYVRIFNFYSFHTTFFTLYGFCCRPLFWLPECEYERTSLSHITINRFLPCIHFGSLASTSYEK